jgi:hypothetical protein
MPSSAKKTDHTQVRVCNTPGGTCCISDDRPYPGAGMQQARRQRCCDITDHTSPITTYGATSLALTQKHQTHLVENMVPFPGI